MATIDWNAFDAAPVGAAPAPAQKPAPTPYDRYLQAYDAAPDAATKTRIGNEYAASLRQGTQAPAAPASAPARGAIDWDAFNAVPAAAKAEPPAPAPTSFGQQVLQQTGNSAAGLIRGAGSIGATLAWPFDKAADLYYGDRGPSLTGLVTGKQPLSRNEERRASMDWSLGDMGADTNSLAYKGGKLGGEIAGTAGAGGLLANGLRAAAPALVAASPTAAAFADALASGGLNVGAGTGSAAGNLAVRGVAGATTGAAQSAAVDPSTAGSGAEIGAALPMGLAAAGPALRKVAGLIGGLPAHVVGMTTGAGSDAISTAYQAGKDGSKAFIDNMRGNVPMADVVEQARDGIANLRAARGDAYRAGMQGVGADKTVLNFQPISDAIDSVNSTGLYKGQRINGSAADTVGAITNKVNEWKALDPQEFHTPEGFDALKKSIGDIRDSTPFATPARRAADTAYNAVKGQIVQQAPDYAKTMKGYEEASSQIDEITKALSLGKNASADTSLRKLQSLMRNNAQTNYGNRVSLAQALQEHGNADIMPALAGQALNSWTPRGAVGALEKGGGALGAAFHPASIPALIGSAPFMSPRLMGEGAYAAGRMASKADPRALGAALLQASGVDPQTMLLATQNSTPLAQALLRSGAVLTPSVSR